MINLILVYGLIASALADRLENTYLPPASARTAGGVGVGLQAPRFVSSYSPPASGPVSSRSFSGGAPVAILRLDNDNNGDGNYRFQYETENQISHQESGQLKNAGTDHESSSVQGSYSYTAPDGRTYTVNYIADENGFRASGDHLPTPPPVPVEIQRSLQINAASADYSEAGAVSRQYHAPQTGGYRY